MLRNVHATNLLKDVISNPLFDLKNAMDLVRRYCADPNIKNNKGKSLLHFIVIKNNKNNIGVDDGKYDSLIKELVITYCADIDIKDDKGYTPFQYLISCDEFTHEEAMKLVRLGANPTLKNDDGISLSEILSSTKNNKNGKNNPVIKELYELTIKYEKENYYTSRNNFLFLLIMLVYDKCNENSNSCFKNLPIEIVSLIVSFINFDKMGKKQEECHLLAKKILSHPEKIKEMSKTPGGINVFQRNNNETNCPEFIFFKSVHTLCRDYKKLKIDIKKEQKHGTPLFEEIKEKNLKISKTIQKHNRLNEFTEKYAITYWNEHCSLYNKAENKKRLFQSIKDSDPYKKSEIQSKMKLT